MLDSQALDESSITALRERYRQLCVARDNCQENVERIQAHQRGLTAEIRDCLAAARVFGCDLGSRASPDTSGCATRPFRSFHIPSIQPRQRALTRKRHGEHTLRHVPGLCSFRATMRDQGSAPASDYLWQSSAGSHRARYLRCPLY